MDQNLLLLTKTQPSEENISFVHTLVQQTGFGKKDRAHVVSDTHPQLLLKAKTSNASEVDIDQQENIETEIPAGDEFARTIPPTDPIFPELGTETDCADHDECFTRKEAIHSSPDLGTVHEPETTNRSNQEGPKTSQVQLAPIQSDVAACIATPYSARSEAQTQVIQLLALTHPEAAEMLTKILQITKTEIVSKSAPATIRNPAIQQVRPARNRSPSKTLETEPVTSLLREMHKPKQPEYLSHETASAESEDEPAPDSLFNPIFTIARHLFRADIRSRPVAVPNEPRGRRIGGKSATLQEVANGNPAPQQTLYQWLCDDRSYPRVLEAYKQRIRTTTSKTGSHDTDQVIEARVRKFFVCVLERGRLCKINCSTSASDENRQVQKSDLTTISNRDDCQPSCKRLRITSSLDKDDQRCTGKIEVAQTQSKHRSNENGPNHQPSCVAHDASYQQASKITETNGSPTVIRTHSSNTPRSF